MPPASNPESASWVAAEPANLGAALVCARRTRSNVDAVRELDVVGVRVEMPSNQPIVLLRESDGERYLPIWIGAVEATAIAFAQQGMTPPRPLTHDLFKDVLDALGARLEQVLITEMRDSTYYAELVFSGGVRVSSRPSDSIAIALRTGTPIFAAEPLLDELGILTTEGDDGDCEHEVGRLRGSLPHASPADLRSAR